MNERTEGVVVEVKREVESGGGDGEDGREEKKTRREKATTHKGERDDESRRDIE